jgi:pimeloyl-ACP methyl ester carboxylesterase
LAEKLAVQFAFDKVQVLQVNILGDLEHNTTNKEFIHMKSPKNLIAKAISFIVAFSLILPASMPAFAAAGSIDETSKKTINLSTGFTMKYIEAGNEKGEPMIFLHGITDSSHSFASTAEYLQDYHLYLLDQRGHGDSERAEGGYTIPQLGEDVIAFMDAKKIDKAIIVGHSMGTFVAHQIASVYPNRVSKLVLIATAPTSVNNAALTDAWKTVGAADFKDPISKDFVVSWQTGPNPIDEKFFDGVVAATSSVPARVWKLAFRGLMSDDHSAFLKDITAPTLIIWGTADSIFLKPDQDAMKKLMPKAKFVEYDKVGHNVQWEQPKRVAEDIQAFVKGK